MKLEQARQRTAQALDQLANALEQGRSEQLLAYLTTMSRFHRYSYGNTLLIMCQKPEATHVAGFNTWKKLGRYVNKGEKGILILAPMKFKQTREDDQGEEKTIHQLRFKAVYVFDVSQTDGEPLPEFASVAGDPADQLDRLHHFATERGIVIEYSDSLGRALGTSSGGLIRIKADLNQAEQFHVLAHELAHELLHQAEGENRPSSKTVRETEAEAVAYVVSHHIGLETGTAFSDYIQLYQGDTKTLADSLDRIQHAASEIITSLELQAEEALATPGVTASSPG